MANPLRWFRRRDPVELAWRELGDRLGLSHHPDGAARLAELLDLPSEATLGPVYALEHAGELEVLVFSYRLPADTRGRFAKHVTACLLVAERPFSPVSWRAGPKVHGVLASIQASASGGQVTELPGDEEFNSRVTLVAREGRVLDRTLGASARRALVRALNRGGQTPTMVVGESRILLSSSGEEVALEELEFRVSDVLTLYAALSRS